MELQDIEKEIFVSKQRSHRTIICATIYCGVWICLDVLSIYFWVTQTTNYTIIMVDINFILHKLYKVLVILIIQGFSEVVEEQYQTLTKKVIDIYNNDVSIRSGYNLIDIGVMYRSLHTLLEKFNNLVEWPIFLLLQSVATQILIQFGILASGIGSSYYNIVVNTLHLFYEIVSTLMY